MGAYFPPVMTKCVLDVSHHNGTRIAWTAVAKANPWIVGVVCKATQGTTFVDPAWAWNAKAIPDAGLKLAAYHYVTSDSPSAQMALISKAIMPLASRLRLDVEAPGLTIKNAELLTTFTTTAMGRRPVIYIGRYGPSGTGAGLPSSTLSQCPLWLPEYGTHPVPPAGWNSWLMWQFTESAMTVAFPGSTVDISYFAGTAAECAANWDC